MIAPADHDAVLRQALDLILVHILQRASRLFRAHPKFSPDDLDAARAHAPARFGARDFTTKSFSHHLVAEADAHERFLRLVNSPREIFQRMNPANVVVSRKARAGGQVGVAGVERRRKLAVAYVEGLYGGLRRVAAEQRGEHLSVISRDVAEPFVDVIAFEQTDLHIEMLTALPIAHYALPIVSQEAGPFPCKSMVNA